MQSVGTLREEIAQELGLSSGVSVAPGSGDNQMSALGAGAVQVCSSSRKHGLLSDAASSLPGW